MTLTYSPQSPDSKLARHRAITTITFLNSDASLPLFSARLSHFLDASPTLALTQEQMDIWKAPEGVPFVNGEFSVPFRVTFLKAIYFQF